VWELKYPDPLQVVLPPLEVLVTEHRYWQLEPASERLSRPFVIDIAADYFHKASVSGGGPYGIEVPNPAVDGPLLAEYHQTTFVNYLRIVFSWAGFPGWDPEHPGFDRPTAPTPPEIAEWAAELVPL
jgi:hypothetical protein